MTELPLVGTDSDEGAHSTLDELRSAVAVLTSTPASAEPLLNPLPDIFGHGK